MAGGNWTTQDKALPGVYINYSAAGNNPQTTAERGIVGLPIPLPWLPSHQIISVSAREATRLYAELGAAALPLREAAKNAATVLLYRLNQGTAATAAIGNLLVTATCGGNYGNGFTVSVEAAVEQPGEFYVVTWFAGREQERQLVTSIDNLKSNDWLTFAKTSEDNILTANAGSALTGGADGDVSSADHVGALEAFETRELDAIACCDAETAVKELYIAYTKRMINEEGKYLQMVCAEVETADFEAVISVKNGVILADGIAVPSKIAAAYIAGATASCPLSGSLTNAQYAGAADVDTRYTRVQQKELAKSGQMIFLPPAVGSTQVTIQKDINTLVTFDSQKTYALSKNKAIRTLFAINKFITGTLNSQFIGKVPNDNDGRAQAKGVILEKFRELQRQKVLQAVVPEDIVLTQGTLIDAVVADYVTRIVDVMETIYTTILVKG